MPHCLIVDDSKVVRKIARRMVEPLGFTVSEAENGREALEVFTRQRADFIILDWHMPEMDGLECIRHLRALPEGKHPKVIFCTTENDFTRITQALEAGADEYVMKPFDEEILKGKMVQVGLLSE